MKTMPVKQEARMDFRLTREEKEKIQKAAVLLGQTVSDFATTTLLRSAEEVLEKHQRTVLSECDFARFLELVDAEDEPTEAAKRASKEYKRGRIEGSSYHW